MLSDRYNQAWIPKFIFLRYSQLSECNLSSFQIKLIYDWRDIVYPMQKTASFEIKFVYWYLNKSPG